MGHGEGNGRPLLDFHIKLPFAGFGEQVKLGVAVVFRFAPERTQPACFLQAMKGWEERPGFDEKCASGNLLDAARDAQTVQFTGAKRLQDQEIKCALQEIRLFGTHLLFPIEWQYEYDIRRTECQ